VLVDEIAIGPAYFADDVEGVLPSVV